MKRFLRYLVIVLPLILSVNISASSIYYLPPGNEKIVAFTFDACETKTPSYFDKKMLSFITKNEIPVTIFLSGKFIERNRAEIKQLSLKPFISFQNHSYMHHMHMEQLSDEAFIDDIEKTSALIESITDKKPLFFRFPGGNYDNRTLKLVEKLGYKSVFWSFESGDPSKHVSASNLLDTVKNHVRNGSILIFHINGRGWHTAEALPDIVEYLKSEHYRFVKLEDMIK